MKKKSSGKLVIAMIVVTIIIVALYIKITNRADSDLAEPMKPKTEVEKLISKDLDNSYPGSPREVVDFYSRIIKCFYALDLTEKQLEDLVSQIRKLFDDEFLLNNPNEEHIEDLKADIIEYKDAKRVIVNYVLQKSSNVEYSKRENKEYSSIIAAYTLKEKDERKKTYQQFIMRKDEKGNWRILGWELTDNIDIEE